MSTGSTAWGASFNSLELAIDAPAEVVWDLLFERSAWMTMQVSRTVVEGEDRSVGAISKIVLQVDDAQVERLEALHLVEQHRRLVVRFWSESALGGGLTDYQLRLSKSGVVLQVTVFGFYTGDAVAYSAEMENFAQSKIESDYSRLKKLAETTR